MSLLPGTRLGPYEIQSAIGAGGMGQVFRAHDTKLGRDVAIKALPELVANDPERIARFSREAQLLAALNHPHVAAIYGIEEAQGARFLVLELVEGESLAQRLATGPLALSEALTVARQIADALQAAHEKGIIHRDLKPANVMLTSEDQVKVLDFGLGKVMEASTSGDVSNSPTMTLGATQVGMILGTAAYMSPEQAKGRPADKRSDIWAFGCVLYEMLTGKRAFPGEDISDTLATVLKSDADWSALPVDVPPAVRTLLQRCLVKDRAERIADFSTVRYVLNAPTAPVAEMPRRSGPRVIRTTAAVAITAVAIAATVIAMRILAPPGSSSGRSTAMHLAMPLPPGDEIADPQSRPLAVSADGTRVVYAGQHGDTLQLFDRPIDSPDAKAIGGTEGAVSPFFSPDGQWIGFFAQGQMKRVSVNGGALQVICQAPGGRGGFWGTDDNIYFAPSNRSAIWKVPASGGSPIAVTKLNPAAGEVSHRWPQLLPGNQALLFTIWTGPGADEKQVAVQPLSGSEHRVLVRGGDTGRYVAPGYLVYGRAEALLAVPMNLSSLDVGTAAPVPLPEHVLGHSAEGAAFDVSEAGALVYLPGGRYRLAQRLVWVDQTGRSDALPLPERNYEQVRISPDRHQALVQIDEGTVGVWVYDFSRATLTPLATGGGSSQAPLWTSDGKRVIYRATRKGMRNLYWRLADGTGGEDALTTKENVSQTPQSASADGQWLIFSENGQQTSGDIWTLRLDGDHQPRPFLATPADEGFGQLSPDGKWIAYASDASGRPDIYVQAFPGPGARRLISRAGGTEPLWSRDGRQLFYLVDDKMMVVDISGGPAFAAGTPRPLYSGRFRFSPNGNTSYDLSPDARRFLRVQQVQPEQPANQIHVVLNWFEELKRVMGAK